LEAIKGGKKMCRLLKAEEIECRVAQVSAKGCSLLLYKTARVDRAILDEEFGVMNWQNDFKTIDGKMYGGIGVLSNGFNDCWKDNPQWVWRWDCGTESNTEAEKGQASDCFKRAGFKWGIGVELYTAPFIWINAETEQYNGKFKLKDKFAKFDVKTIGYDDNRNINKLVIVDSKGKVVYSLGVVLPLKDFTNQKTVISNTPQNVDLSEPITPTEEKDLDSELQDLDIFNGLDAITDMANLKIYYTENKDKVSDIKGFNKKVNARKKQLGA
jgi:hypothetical protein